MRILVLCSGGMKSLLLAVAAQKEGTPLLLYMDHHTDVREQELKACQQIASYTHADELLVQDAPDELFQHYDAASLVMQLTWLLPIAQTLRCSEIYHGFNKSQYGGILQQSPLVAKFLTTLSTLIELIQPTQTLEGQYIGRASVEMPLYRLTLRHMIRLGQPWYVPWNLTYSCLQGDEVHCGKCIKCTERKIAFYLEELQDPIIYRV